MISSDPRGRSIFLRRARAVMLVLCWIPPLALALGCLGTWQGIALVAASMLASALTCLVVVRALIVPGIAGPLEDPSEHSGQSGASLAPATASRAFDGSFTLSGLYDSPVNLEGDGSDSVISGTYSIIDMVNRLEPERFCWIQSSPAEQQFLGWTLDQLRSKSFLDIVEEADRPQAERGLRHAVSQGEYHGLVVRIRTAHGKSRAIEVHASARYAIDQRVTYLRCLLTDVTEKLRTERERQLRNLELSRVNAQLRRINEELVALKDRYSDLYENAPAMYFSLDGEGRLIECNQTFLKSLDRRREEMIGRGFDAFLDPADFHRCRQLFGNLLASGSIETESRWVKASGEAIEVWVSGTVVRGSRGEVEHTRCVAQDLTARHRLEAELRESYQSLARVNADLSAKNRELDEFVHVVSHDLQEPVRTLIGFSDFLLESGGPGLDPAAQDHLLRLSAAARRMRSMIQGLLNLSRAGRIIEDPAPIELASLVEIVRADLAELIRTRNAIVHLDGAGGLVWGDRRRLQQLLTNLVANGIKYNQSEVPRVELSLTVGHDAGGGGAFSTIRVRDNGIGIDPRHHQKIFQLFRRLHPQEDYPGTGVGLALCNKIVQAHGGEIRVESQPGQGATFFVSLPAGPWPTARPEPASAGSQPT